MKILVTGAQGYIGSVLAPFLAERGHEVTALDSGFFKEGILYPPPAVRSDRLRPLQKDVREIRVDEIEGFDAVIHLAELSNDPLGELDTEITRQVNYLGSAGFIKKCKLAGVPRFVYSSSCSVYGVADEGFRTEESETVPQTAYARCKILVEQALLAAADRTFSPVILRNATAYGPSPHMRFDIVLNNLAGLAWTTQQIRMTSDGTPWRPLVHVRDICRAMLCAVEAPSDAVHGETFNVGRNEHNYRVREIAEIVAGIFPGCTLTMGKSDGDNRSYRVSFDKIHRALPAFQAEDSPETGACELLEVLRRVRLTPEAFNSRSFIRLKQLQFLLETRQLTNDLFWQTDPVRRNGA